MLTDDFHVDYDDGSVVALGSAHETRSDHSGQRIKKLWEGGYARIRPWLGTMGLVWVTIGPMPVVSQVTKDARPNSDILPSDPSQPSRPHQARWARAGTHGAIFWQTDGELDLATAGWDGFAILIAGWTDELVVLQVVGGPDGARLVGYYGEWAPLDATDPAFLSRPIALWFGGMVSWSPVLTPLAVIESVMLILAIANLTIGWRRRVRERSRP